MDYKKKYLKYKMKYLEAKKLYGGMNAETLKTRVNKIATNLPEFAEKWKQNAEEEYNSSEKLRRMIEQAPKGYANEKMLELHFYRDPNMINEIVKIKDIKFIEDLERILEHWENIAKGIDLAKEDQKDAQNQEDAQRAAEIALEVIEKNPNYKIINYDETNKTTGIITKK